MSNEFSPHFKKWIEEISDPRYEMRQQRKREKRIGWFIIFIVVGFFVSRLIPHIGGA